MTVLRANQICRATLAELGVYLLIPLALVTVSGAIADEDPAIPSRAVGSQDDHNASDRRQRSVEDPRGNKQESEDPLANCLAGESPFRRLFLDAMVVEESQGLERVFHAAEKRVATRSSAMISRGKAGDPIFTARCCATTGS